MNPPDKTEAHLRDGSRKSGETVDDGESQIETGRRFGNNTVEYFA